MARIWSDQQKAIFQWFKTGAGNLVVVARAGTAKTTTILEGINDAPERKILLAAFSKKIAVALQADVKHPGAECKTLHALGFAYVRRYWSGVRVDDTYCANPRGLRLATQAAGGDQAPEPMIKLVRKLADLGKNICPFPQLADMVTIAEEYEVEPDEEWVKDGWNTERIATCAMKAMDLAATKDGTIDFNDMVFVPVRNRWITGTYDLVVIDECQDMNATQIALAIGACRTGGRIAVIGDDRQAIYGFRGADSQSLERLRKELAATEMRLTRTFRCPRTVVALAKMLVPDYEAADTVPEGVITTIMSDQLAKSVAIGDFVLSRTNAPLASACLKILRAGIRAKVEGKDIGQGLVALVRKLGKGRAAHSMPVFLEKLTTWEEKEVARWQAARKQHKVEEMQDRAETIRVLSDGLTGVPEMVRRIEDLFTDDAKAQPCVVLSSIHRAKGLETDHVFILQYTLAVGSRRTLEEQNIEYVGYTRAKQELTFVKKSAPQVQAPLTLSGAAALLLNDDDVAAQQGGLSVL